MSTHKMMVSVVDPDGKWLHRVGGISASVGPFLVSALEIATIIVSTLTLVWFLLVGYRLLRVSSD